MNLNEMLNPWKALRLAKLEVAILKRERSIRDDELFKTQTALTMLQERNMKLRADLAKAQKNDSRGKDGKFKKGDSK